MAKTKPKDIGTAFETKCVKSFVAAGFNARRLALSGANDCGDVELHANDDLYVVECKCYKSWTRKDVEIWREQADTEAKNYAAVYDKWVRPVLIVSQYNKSHDSSFVHCLFDQRGWNMMYLDEFIRVLRDDAL